MSTRLQGLSLTQWTLLERILQWSSSINPELGKLDDKWVPWRLEAGIWHLGWLCLLIPTTLNWSSHTHLHTLAWQPSTFRHQLRLPLKGDPPKFRYEQNLKKMGEGIELEIHWMIDNKEKSIQWMYEQVLFPNCWPSKNGHPYWTFYTFTNFHHQLSHITHVYFNNKQN